MGLVLIQHRPAQYIDQGGPCGHSDPYTGADDCLCRDGYMIPAYFTTGYTSDYCDGEPTDSGLFADFLGREHAEHCEYYRPYPW